MNKHQTLKRILDDRYLVLIISFIAVFALLLIYKLGSVPKIFVDERSYMDEVQSLLYTGSDLNNLVRPIYFKGPFGNGQSITYALFAVPFTKLFGFSVLKFRLPMILLTLINLILILFYLTPHKKSQRL